MDILRISIVIAAVGIIALFFITQYKNEKVSKIADLKVGQIERIEGMVNSVYTSKDRHVFLKVSDSSGDIDVVAFKSANIDLAYELENGDQVTVLGKVEEYKGKNEIVASSMERV
jgi:exonuclease VII large subunit